jgi:FixJ family two-component response regulator
MARELVVVVDDDTAVLRSLQRVLQGRGHEVEAFDTAKGVLERARLGEAKCLVLDINLNGTCGIDLRRQVAGAGYKVPVVFITASVRESTQTAALEAGCVAFLKKPFSSDELFEAVDSAVRSDGPTAL